MCLDTVYLCRFGCEKYVIFVYEGWIPTKFKTLIFKPKLSLSRKITQIITRVKSRIFTNSSYMNLSFFGLKWKFWNFSELSLCIRTDFFSYYSWCFEKWEAGTELDFLRSVDFVFWSTVRPISVALFGWTKFKNDRLQTLRMI